MPSEKPTSVRFPPELHRKLRKIATHELRSIAAQLNYIVETFVTWWEKQKR